MNVGTLLALVSVALIGTSMGTAHFPPAPDTACNAGTDGAGGATPHDFNAAGSVTVTTGLTGERGIGVAVLHDGALFPCGFAPLCPPGDSFIVGECETLPPEVQNILVPLGDGEYEFGLAGAFLPESHHAPDLNGYVVEGEPLNGGFIFGSDQDGDGNVLYGGVDCYESHDAVGSYTTSCLAGVDGGWWLFTKCNARTLSDWTFSPNGSPPDWDPMIVLGSIPPDFAVNCLALGHVSA
ncbi:MAG TPA: hypothetical protein VHH36_05880 [Candidatus Thermoplasmatota archaeon]|nr:hypothetical protein [Candidatus Thermoplasmatota archaeon]